MLGKKRKGRDIYGLVLKKNSRLHDVLYKAFSLLPLMRNIMLTKEQARTHVLANFLIASKSCGGLRRKWHGPPIGTDRRPSCHIMLMSPFCGLSG